MPYVWVSTCILLTSLATSVQSASLTILLTDELNQPVADAVVELIASKPSMPAEPGLGTIAQQDLTFVPFVSAFMVGSYIEFPNRDKTRHNVYSFSPAKTFETKLYAGQQEAPIEFDKPGIVTIGCNIHDYMQAYVYIGSSPLLAVSDSEGKINFSDLAFDTYQLNRWHPWQKNVHDSLSVIVDRDSNVVLSMAIQPQQKPTAPKRGFGN